MAFSKSSIGVPNIGDMIRDLLPDSARLPGAAVPEAPIHPIDEAAPATVVTPEHGQEPQAREYQEREYQERESNAPDVARPAADPEEAALVVQAQQNPDAFDVLYERYVDRVYSYIYNRVGNTQEAEDLTARTFYRALSRISTYEDRGFPFSAWLFRIAHNLVANWHRDHSKRRFLSLDRIWSHSKEGELPELRVEQEEKHNALWDAINRLPADRRDLLIHKFSSRLSNVEIGEIMDKSESAIKSLYFRTLAALRSDLESRNWER